MEMLSLPYFQFVFLQHQYWIACPHNHLEQTMTNIFGQETGNKLLIQVSFISIWLLMGVLAHHASIMFTKCKIPDLPRLLPKLVPGMVPSHYAVIHVQHPAKLLNDCPFADKTVELVWMVRLLEVKLTTSAGIIFLDTCLLDLACLFAKSHGYCGLVFCIKHQSFEAIMRRIRQYANTTGSMKNSFELQKSVVHSSSIYTWI